VKFHNLIEIKEGRMKRIAIAVSVVCLIFGGLILAQTQTPSVEQELIRLENNWNEAIVKHDWAFFDQILAEDYISTNFDGSVGTKADFLEFLKSGESVMASSIVDDMKVRIYGEAAVVTGRVTTVKELYQGKDLSGRYRWTDTWVKDYLGHWKCVAEHVSRIAQK
jgi:ketosteroid isomerase-like protein